MIDTIHLVLDVADMEGVTSLHIANNLGFDLYHNDGTGEVWSKGKMGNLELSFNGGCMRVCGSVPQWYFATNARNMTRHDVEDAITRLSDELGVDMSKAVVTRLDIAHHWEMSRPVTEYLPMLLQLPRFKRDAHWRGTLYYNQSDRSLCFYNKTTEAKKHKKQMPTILEAMNVLRYELRFKHHVSRWFGQQVVASTLANKEFYMEMVKKWYDAYMSIIKGGEPVVNVSTIRSAKGAQKWLLGHYIAKYGVKLFEDDLQIMKERGVFEYRKYYSQLKQYANEAVSMVASSSERNIISELTDNVVDVYNYCR